MNESAIRKALDEGVRTWLITGDSPLLVERAAGVVLAWGRDRCGPPQFNLTVAHAADDSAVAAFSSARTLPMMADLRVIVVRELDQGTEAVLGALAGYLAKPSASTLLIVSGAGFPPIKKGTSNWSLKITPLIKTAGRHVKYSASDVSPVSFAREHARSIGKELGAHEATLLVELVGTDLGALAREVEKVAVYSGDTAKITTDAIQEASSLLAEAVIWDLTTGIAVRDAEIAIPALHRLLDSGDASHRLLGLVLWQLRQALQIVELQAAGRGEYEILNAVKGQPAQIRRILATIGKNPPSTAAVLERVARANRLMNSHRAGDRRIFEGLVLDLCRR